MAEKVTIGNCELWHGDCREVLPLLAFDAIVTDPPYGLNYSHGAVQTGKWQSKHDRVKIEGDDKPFDPAHLLTGKPCLLWGANNFADKLPIGGWLAWNKRDGIEQVKFSMSDAELAWMTKPGATRMFHHLWFGLARASEIGEHMHPTQKPVALMKWCIDQLGAAGVIADPYLGSGSTGVAAVHMGRPFVGIEIDAGHFETACRRIEQAYAQPRLFEDAKVGAGDTAVQGDMLLPANVVHEGP